MDVKRVARSQKPEARRGRAAGGFSLIEVLLLVVVLGIVGAAAGRALQSMAKVPGQTDLNFQIETRLISKMEQIRAQAFDSVGNAAPSVSDTVAINGVTYNRTVTVVTADANADGTADATFKQVTVSCGGQTVTTLISR